MNSDKEDAKSDAYSHDMTKAMGAGTWFKI